MNLLGMLKTIAKKAAYGPIDKTGDALSEGRKRAKAKVEAIYAEALERVRAANKK